ncbi:MAG TPA: peptidylprolyl isomerase [Elusimicrobiales bacterium]|nr:peptidylprolyl isomerase [Elusimicrobiales bacterium]
MKQTTIFCAICAALACACSGGKPPEGAIAKVGKTYITQGEFENKLSDINPEFRGYAMSRNGKKQFLEILIREKLALLAAQDSKTAGSSEYKHSVDQRAKELQDRLEEYKQYLLTKIWVEQLKKDGALGVTEEDLRQYYKKYPYEVSISHILVATPQEGEDILKALRSGKNFAALAKEKSLDAATASNGGQVPPFVIGQFLPELEAAAAGMRTGETQGVFKSKFGYHIIKKHSQTDISLDQARDRMRLVLEKTKFDSYINSLQKKYKVEVLDANFKYD